MLKKMEQAKKKAEAVVNTVDISEREKMAQLKRSASTSTRPLRFIPTHWSLIIFSFLHSQHLQEGRRGEGKRDLTYIVAKKGVGRRVRRPAGVKGTFRVVDGRLKKDTRATQRKEQRERGKGGRGIKEGGAWRQEKDVRIRSDGRPSRPRSDWLIELLVSFMSLSRYTLIYLSSPS